MFLTESLIRFLKVHYHKTGLFFVLHNTGYFVTEIGFYSIGVFYTMSFTGKFFQKS